MSILVLLWQDYGPHADALLYFEDVKWHGASHLLAQNVLGSASSRTQCCRKDSHTQRGFVLLLRNSGFFCMAEQPLLSVAINEAHAYCDSCL